MSDELPRILVMGPPSSGKTSILHAILLRMSHHVLSDPPPHTEVLDILKIDTIERMPFEVWDFPGGYELDRPYRYDDQELAVSAIVTERTSIIYVLDGYAASNAFDTIPRLQKLVECAQEHNPDIHIDVFVHKVDPEVFQTEDLKSDVVSLVEQIVSEEMEGGNNKLTYHHTSCTDYSIYEAFSKVMQRMIPQQTAMQSLINSLINDCDIEKAFIFDIVHKLYITTDFNPVDMSLFELCSDMLDVVVDISAIYGLRPDADGDENDLGGTFDEQASSVIRLEGGMVLYLRQVGTFLALTCVISEQNFTKQPLIDYNIDCFRVALSRVLDMDNKVSSPGIEDSASALANQSSNSITADFAQDAGDAGGWAIGEGGDGGGDDDEAHAVVGL